MLFSFFLNYTQRSAFPCPCALKCRARRSQRRTQILRHPGCLRTLVKLRWPDGEAGATSVCKSFAWEICSNCQFSHPTFCLRVAEWGQRIKFLAIETHLSDAEGVQKHTLRNTGIGCIFCSDTVKELEITQFPHGSMWLFYHHNQFGGAFILLRMLSENVL